MTMSACTHAPGPLPCTARLGQAAPSLHKVPTSCMLGAIALPGGSFVRSGRQRGSTHASPALQAVLHSCPTLCCGHHGAVPAPCCRRHSGEACSSSSSSSSSSSHCAGPLSCHAQHRTAIVAARRRPRNAGRCVRVESGSCCGPSNNPHSHNHSSQQLHNHDDEHSNNAATHSHGDDHSCGGSGAHDHDHDHDHDEHGHGHSHSHGHSHGHGHGHHHHHGPRGGSGPLYRAVDWVLSRSGLAVLGARLEASPFATAGMIAAFLVAALGQLALSHHAALAEPAVVAARAALAWGTAGVFVLGGLPEGVELCYSTAQGQVDTHVLMSLAAIGTYVMGAALEGALLLVLFRVSHLLEHALTSRAAGNLDALLGSCPQHAAEVDLDPEGRPLMSSLTQALAADVRVGSTILVRPGEQVPLDGEVLYGQALVSAEHITGESLPLLKRPGQQVAAGSVAHDGLLVLRTTRSADDSTPARIAKLTSSAQARKPKLRRWIDDFGEWYSKAVIFGTLAAAVGMLMAGMPLLSSATQRGVLYRAMGVLTVASPCALAMVPLAYVSAVAAITQRGLLLKGTAILDALTRCDVVAFDKTGTLTSGAISVAAMLDPASQEQEQDPAAKQQQQPRVKEWDSSISGSSGGASLQALAVAVALSQRSTHPISRALSALGETLSARQQPLPQVQVDHFRLTPGAGVQGIVLPPGAAASADNTEQGGGDEDGRASASSGVGRYAQLGSPEFVRESLPEEQALLMDRELATDRATGGAVSVLVIHPGPQPGGPGQYTMRVFVFEDTVRTRSKSAVKVLRSGSVQGQPSGRHVRVMMLTGDNAASAGRVGRLLDIRDVRAGLAPEEKLAIVSDLAGWETGNEQQQPLVGVRPKAEARKAAGGSNLLRAALASLRSAWAAALRSGGGRVGGVIMVGDGINDAPALAAATVGMAVVATPAEAAAGAADVLCLNRDPISSIPYLLAVAHQTRAVVMQNLLLAGGSVLALVLPTVCGLIPLWLAVSLHEGTTVLVALNSLRLLGARPHQDLMAGGREGAAAAGVAAANPGVSSGMAGAAVAAPAQQQGGPRSSSDQRNAAPDLLALLTHPSNGAEPHIIIT